MSTIVLQVDVDGDIVSSTPVINIGPNTTTTIDEGDGGIFFTSLEEVCGTAPHKWYRVVCR